MLNNDKPPAVDEVLAEEKLSAFPPQPRTNRIAVLGGTFDPPHTGHIALAKQVLLLDLCDEVMFIPSGNPPHKDARFLSSPEQRMDMLRLAVEGYDSFSVSDIELQRREGKSYIFDTLQVLSKAFPGDELYFLMGMDCLHDLHNWHRATELVQFFNFIIYPRSGLRTPSRAELNPRFGVRASSKLLNSIINIDDLPIWDVSSRDLREAKRKGGDLSSYLNEKVWQYILSEKLYQN